MYVNSAAAEMMHADREVLFGKTPSEFPMPMHVVFLWQAGLERVFKGSSEKSFEYEFDDLHTVHHLQIHMIPEYSAEGIVEFVLAVTRDLSEQHRTVVALRESEERFRLALRTTPITVYTQDGSLRYTWVYSSNPKLPAEFLLDHTDSGIYPAKKAKQIAGVKYRVMQTGIPERAEFEAITPKGRIWLDITIAPLLNNEAQAVGITGIALDITQRKQVEGELRESEERYREIVETAHEGIAIHAPDGVITYVNRRMADMLGYSPEEIIGKSNLDFVDDEEKRAVTKSRERIHAENGLTEERKLRRKDGSILWTLSNLSPRRDHDGNFTGYLAMHTDITGRKRTEEALKESEELYRLVVENTTAIILRMDPAGIIRFANERALEFFGYSKEELIGRHTMGTIIPERETTGRDLTTMVGEIIKNPDRFHSNANENMRKNGERLWMEWTNSGIYGADGNLKEFLSVGIDATERKRAETQIARLRREHEAFMRHEMKNLFTPMQLFAELVLDSNNLTDDQIHYLKRIVDTAKRAAGFIDSLRQLQDIEAEKYTLNRIRESLKAVIGRAIQNLEPLSEKSGAAILFRASKNEFMMEMDPHLMPGVFTNLIQNAIEHVAVRTNPAEKVVTIDLTREKDRYIVHIHNWGEPIPPERVKTFFDKFNVGPEKKGGTGLGTTYAWLVVKAHGGTIRVSSNDGEGTTVTVELPE